MSNTGSYPYIRGRRLRQNENIRRMAAEHHLHPEDFIAPLFVMEGQNQKVEIPSMPGYYRYTLDLLMEEAQEIVSLGIPSVLLFVKVPDEKKDNEGTEALNPEGLMQQSVGHQKRIPGAGGDDRCCTGSLFELRPRRNRQGW
jgi:porphobilinogen synthase